jgi:deoxyhypusine synthase
MLYKLLWLTRRDGACSSSTLKEASSWGKVDITKEQMVFAEQQVFYL